MERKSYPAAPMSTTSYHFNDHVRLDSAGYMYCEGTLVKGIQDWMSDHCSLPSPFYLYSLAQIKDNVSNYLDALGQLGLDKNHMLGFAIKANCNLEILKILRSYGCSAIAFSGNEIKLAVAAGFDPSAIIFHGNGKQKWELLVAIRQRCLIAVDSEFDLKNIISLSTDLEITSRVLLRINLNINTKTNPNVKKEQISSKFGMTERDMDNMLDIIQSDSYVDLTGLHCHLVSTIDDTFLFRKSAEVVIRLLDHCKRRGFDHIEYVNLGGGLGVDNAAHAFRTVAYQADTDNGLMTESEITNLVESQVDETSETYEDFEKIWTAYKEQRVDLPTLETEFIEIFRDYPEILHRLYRIIPQRKSKVEIPTPLDLVDSIKSLIKESRVSLILEPGRSLVGDSALLITKVIGSKYSAQKRYLVVDASMTELIRPCLYSAYHHIELAEPSLARSHEKVVYDVVGPVCECSDFLGKDRLLPIAHPGCGVAIFDVGAYCANMASNYSMRMRPAEVLVDGNTWRLIRHPDTFEDLIRPYQDLDLLSDKQRKVMLSSPEIEY